MANKEQQIERINRIARSYRRFVRNNEATPPTCEAAESVYQSMFKNSVFADDGVTLLLKKTDGSVTDTPIGRFYLADLSADVQGSNWQGFIAKSLNKSLQEIDLHNCLVLVKNPDSLACGSYTTRNMLLLIGDSIFLADRYGEIARPVLSDSAKNANEKNLTAFS